MTTRIKFEGFAAGADVVLSSEGQTASTGLSGWGGGLQAGDHSAQIVVRRGELRVNPEGINFEVTLDGFDTPGPVGGANTYDPQFHNIYYFWDFGDPGSVFTAPQNIAAAHKNANRAYGPIASHTYQSADTYTASVLVIEPASGKMASASVDVTVEDAEVLFAGDRTIFVSTDETFVRAPAGAQTVETWAAAVALQGSLQILDGTKMYRIMFDRDVDHEVEGTGQFRSGFKNIWACSAPGDGSKAKLTCSTSSPHGIVQDLTTFGGEPTKQTDIVFHDLEINGYYDVQTETMGGPYALTSFGGDVFLSVRSQYGATYALFNDVDSSGFNALYTSLSNHISGDPDTLNLIFNNVAVTSWSNFAVFENEQGFSAYTGVRLTQDPLSVSGNSKTIGGLEHGPMRLQLCGKCVIHSSDFFSRNGWFENTQGIHTPQPCLRWNQAGSTRAKLNMQGCAMEGGVNVLFLAPQDSRYATVINNVLIDKTALVGCAFTSNLIMGQHAGTTLRNCVLVHAGDRTHLGAFELGSFVRFDARNLSSDYLATPNRMYSNTLVNRVSDAQTGDGDASVTPYRLTNVVGADFNDVVDVNNLLHQPDLDTPDVGFGPVSEALLFEPRYKDYRDHSILSTHEPLAVNVADGGTLFFEYSQFGPEIGLADFNHAPTNPRHPHQISVNNSRDDAVYTFDNGGVSITNQSGATWPSGALTRAILTGSSLNIRPEYGTPSDAVISAAPLPGSAAIGAAISGLRALDDFYGAPRPEYASIGAFEIPQ